MRAALSHSAPEADPNDLPPAIRRTDSRSAPAPAARRRRILFSWTLVIAWAAVIWTLGGDSFSASSPSADWLRWLFEDLDPRTKYKLLVAIRKSAHFTEYAILAVLTFRAALLSAPRHPLTTAVWVALFIVATLAGADEIRQAFSPVRTGSPYDVMLDLSGGVVAILGVALITRRMRPASNPIESSA
jgi:VanZ family protein